MLPLFFVLNYLGWFRSDQIEEIIGLNVSYHSAEGITSDENDDPYRQYVEQKVLKDGKE
jgi:hypothetical protein